MFSWRNKKNINTFGLKKHALTRAMQKTASVLVRLGRSVPILRDIYGNFRFLIQDINAVHGRSTVRA